MRRFLLMFALACWVGSLATPLFATTSGPQVGQDAPAFRLQDQNGKWLSPTDFHGQWLVMYFYPKDFSPGCTAEVCGFRDDVAKLRQDGAVVVGVSLNNVKSHAEFAAKYHVPFPLLSDADSHVSKRYGVFASMMGLHYAKRTTFLIDPQGRIVKIYRDVDPERNSTQVVNDLNKLKKASS